MGGEERVLVGLKAAMIACVASDSIATSKRHAWVDAWIDTGFTLEVSTRIRTEAATIGATLLEGRRALDLLSTVSNELSRPSNEFHEGATAANVYRAAPLSSFPGPLLSPAPDDSDFGIGNRRDDNGRGVVGDENASTRPPSTQRTRSDPFDLEHEARVLVTGDSGTRTTEQLPTPSVAESSTLQDEIDAMLSD